MTPSSKTSPQPSSPSGRRRRPPTLELDSATPPLADSLRQFFAYLRPPPRLSVSEWSDRNRRLPETSPEPGRWKTSRTPYLREIMDTASSPGIHTCVFIKPSQIGGTEALLNVLGYFADLDPCNIFLVLPTLALAEDFSKDRVEHLFRDTPQLADVLADPKTRSSDSTILFKRFRGRGGALRIAGANSPTTLSSWPARVSLLDEYARFALSSGNEGDPKKLIDARMSNFWNAFQYIASTPTIKGTCRIEAAYLESDRRRWYVPCTRCNKVQPMEWRTATGGVRWEPGHPESAEYVCSYCPARWNDVTRWAASEAGHYIAEAPERTARGVAGFALNALVSPWLTLEKLVREWYEAQSSPTLLQAFVNTRLGETWEETGEHGDPKELMMRREVYEPGTLPRGAAVITAFADCQDDRLAVLAVGWGRDRQSWVLDYTTLWGDPSGPKLWEALDAYRSKTWTTETGHKVPIAAMCIDSGGHHTAQVYAYAKARFAGRVWATKGFGGPGRPLMGRPTRNNIGKVHLFPIGSDTGKNLLHAFLGVSVPGPGFVHFPMYVGADFFAELTAEHNVTKYKNGMPYRTWELRKTGSRNEALDCYVGALAALEGLGLDLNHAADLLAQREEARRLESEQGTKAGAAAPAEEPAGTTGWRPSWLK